MEMFSRFAVKHVMHTVCDEPHLRSVYFCICTRFLMSIKQTKHIKQAHNFPGEILLSPPLPLLVSDSQRSAVNLKKIIIIKHKVLNTILHPLLNNAYVNQYSV